MFKFIIISSFLCMTLLASGQNSGITPEKPYIEVTGTAEKEIVPDEIYIAIVIREKYENKEKISIESQEEKLKSAIQSLEISVNELSLSDANADYVKIRWKQKDVLTKKDYILKVGNATLVGNVFQELEKLEISDAYISRVDHSQIEEFRKEVKIMAIKAAKNKADYLLTAIGEKTGKALIVRESEINSFTNVSANTAVGRRYDVSKSNDDDIQFQKIKLQSSIYVKFAIEE